MRRAAWLLTSALALGPAVAAAQGPEDPRIAALQAQLDAQAAQIATQQTLLDQARADLEAARKANNRFHDQLADLTAELAPDLAATTARGAAPGLLAQNTIPTAPNSPPAQVGQAPPPAENAISEAVLPQGVNILTPPGKLMLDAGVSYVESGANVLVFRGIEIVPGVQIGAIDANTTTRNQAVANLTARYGLFPRAEIEVMVPYAYGTSRITEVSQRNQQVTQSRFLKGYGAGDVEFTGRYQLNSGENGGSIVVANLRVKPPTGKGPFDVDYDSAGVAQELATGSGFWGIEPSISSVFTTDPAIIFASAGYLYTPPRKLNKNIGGTMIGKVDPGDSLNTSVGFAFAVNPKFNVSFGFRNSYVFGGKTQLGGTDQKSQSVEVGSLLFGMSYRISPKTSLAGNFEFGVTSDAPNLTASLRVPLSF